MFFFELPRSNELNGSLIKNIQDGQEKTKRETSTLTEELRSYRSQVHELYLLLSSPLAIAFSLRMDSSTTE